MRDDTPIAIIGYSYRAPGVGRKGLWEFLTEAKSAWSKVPSDRFDQDAYYHPNSEKAGCFSTKGGHFLPDDIYSFDAAFFNLRAEEARVVDPHHRMMLECAFEAAENAGLTLLDIAGSNTGVFSAIANPEYGQDMSEDLPTTTTWAATGVAPTMFANRLSYFFDASGPSISLDAACASSAYAVHMACQSLRTGECNAAFVNAASLLMSHTHWTMLDTMGALSSTGRSFSYDKKASGFGRGEGAACLLIKRLSDALENGDPIQAVIRNSAVNHSGRSEGITMPSRSAQEKLLFRVHDEIGLAPSTTAVVEGHGTGTQVGDPIEAGAFATVLGSGRGPANPLYIGSLKSNFGHLEGASGILGIIKAVLMIRNAIILPTAGFEELNKHIDGGNRLRVLQTPTRWPNNEAKRVLVTNFGFGGSNAAVLIEESSAELSSPNLLSNGAPLNNGTSTSIANMSSATNGTTNGIHLTNGESLAQINGTTTNGHQNDELERLFVLSAKSEACLTSYISNFSKFLETTPKAKGFLADLSFTLRERRTHHPYRIAVSANSVAGVKDGAMTTRPTKIKERVIAFAFTGQGAQHARMAVELQRFKSFSTAIHEADRFVQQMGGRWSLKEELERPEEDSRINDAEISQPACTAVQIALTLLLRSWGVVPAVVTGHSSGEIAAAFTAGLISFKGAMAVAYFRGQAAAQLEESSGSKGGMLALGTGIEEASSLIQQVSSGYATVAAVNSLQSVTISGDDSVVEAVQGLAEAKGLFARRLKIKVAYHSRHMEQVAASYLASIEPYVGSNEMLLKDQDSIFVSSVTGQTVDSDTVNAAYWIENLVKPVRFADAIGTVFSPPRKNETHKTPNTIIEIGPHTALRNPIKHTIASLQRSGDQGQTQFTYLASLLRGTRGDAALVALAGNLFSLGASIQLPAVHEEHHKARVLTDLPPYAWDRSTRYIFTSRIAQEKRHPGIPYHELLGWKQPSTGGNEHTFRQVFTLDEMPWIRDHNVLGHAVFPMTGYLSMAIEALRRITPTAPATVVIQEFHAKRSLEIEEDERVDIMTKLKPAASGAGAYSTTAWSFEVVSWSETHGWTTHCFGRIEAESEEMSMGSLTMKESLPLIHSDQVMRRDVRREYAAWSEDGTLYGPTFQAMVSFAQGSGFTVMERELRELNQSMPSQYGSAVSVDPPTLDGFLQGIGPLQEIDGKRPAQMPNYVSRLRVSNHIPEAKQQRFTVVTRMLSYDTKAGSLRISSAVYAHADGSLIPIVEWESVTLRTVGTRNASDSTLNLPSGYSWDLLPSLYFSDLDKVTSIIATDPVDDDERQERRRFNLVAVHYMNQAVKRTTNDDTAKLPPHLTDLLNWMKRVVNREQINLAEVTPSTLAKVAAADAPGEMLTAVGENLVPILRGEVQPLEILLKDNLLTRHYEQDKANARSSRVLARCVRILHDINPNMRILEIGGGTGSATLPVLQELSRGSERSLRLDYVFTDISAGFFENASSKLADWKQDITFKKLDIGADPLSQGFKTDSFDLVIASNVLHATPDMSVTMNNVRSLLKPNGKLVLLEGTYHAPATLPFVLLPGWWLSEDDYRVHEDGPLLTEKSWNRLLLDTGFSGIDGTVSDTAEQMAQVMWSTRISKDSIDAYEQSIAICGPLRDDAEQEFAQLVSESISEHLGYPTEVVPFAELDTTNAPFCIFVDSPTESVFIDTPEEHFDALKAIFLESSGLLWISPQNPEPEARSIKGILTTLRLENTSKNYFILENTPYTMKSTEVITRITGKLQDPELAGNSLDQDLVFDDGMLKLPRLRQQRTAKEVFSSEAGVLIRKEQNLWQDDASLELTVEAAGSADSIYFRRSEAFAQQLGDEDILVRVETAGMNFRDVLLILGSIPWTPPGFEGVGVVVRAGRLVQDVKIGDRVFFANDGSFSTYLQMSHLRACKVPDGISSIEAASIPVAYSTALMALKRVGRLRKGETVLIHAASGATGQACIVLAQYIGARIFATAGSPAKRDFLHDTFGIPKSQIFSSRTSEFRDGILCATGGKGIDVIVNSLTGNLLQDTWALIAEFGRFVEIGKRDFLQNSHLGMRPFNQNVTFSGVDLRALFEKRPEELKECLKEIVELLQQKVVIPIRPITTLPVSQLATGLRKLQSGNNIGKIVVTLGPDERVLAECPAPLGGPGSQVLSSDATYLITGGTGGIGLSLASWMIDVGARNVVLLGRSGSSRPEVRSLLERYNGTDVQLKAVSCDVGSKTELVDAIQSIQGLPPVRGVVHGALYLHDALFENATYDDWQRVTRPRVQGAWNLHEQLPNLDFFVALSSFLGSTGNIGQAIYGGTSTFFDAFAQHRNSLGLPGVSIALPVVEGVGYVADRGITETLKNSLGATLTESDVRTLVKGAIIGPSSGLVSDSKSIAFTFAFGAGKSHDPERYFHPRALAQYAISQHDTLEHNAKSQNGIRVSNLGEINGDPLLSLLDALIGKVSSITMIERDEVEPDAPLANYGLDSLVSVELRNWIRRETGVELPLSTISRAETLRALASHTLSQRK